ncbi:hypothetical protein [Streptomyces globisporus]|uniref:hypothetical protein n=1 Tax=Streptomyces globisporus TaxID=1908 RepID=UPI0037911A49
MTSLAQTPASNGPEVRVVKRRELIVGGERPLGEPKSLTTEAYRSGPRVDLDDVVLVSLPG